VALGGGHGLASTLAAGRRYAGRLTAVVSVADDGGSSGRLREIAGIPAPGDLRRCLVALAAERSPWSRAFEYRFPAGSGELEGHALGNLIIAGLANMTGDFAEALERAAEMLGAVGPDPHRGEGAGGEVIGQVKVSETGGPIRRVSVVPPDAAVPEEALDAIAGADQVVLGPGSLFTSVLAVAVVPAIREALEARRSGRVYVCNLRPQPPETDGYAEGDHLRAVLAHEVPIDVMVAPERPGPARSGERLHGVPVVRAPIRRADGDGHDLAGLAAVLSRLT
jgi:uncharacterized cofD-like protein